MIDRRRDYVADTEFLRMDQYWRDLACEDFDQRERDHLPMKIEIKEYESPPDEDYKRKAGIIALGNSVKVVVDRRMMASASAGDKLDNFTLAHEFTHLALDHLAQHAAIKNFQLKQVSNGGRIIPPDEVELEAHVGAVYFLCGPAILNPKADARSLSDRARCDQYQIEKVLRWLRVSEFRDELERDLAERERRRATIERVVL